MGHEPGERSMGEQKKFAETVATTFLGEIEIDMKNKTKKKIKQQRLFLRIDGNLSIIYLLWP